MLKLTIKPGEFINIGNDIRVVYSGGTDGNIHLLIDAPRELNKVRFFPEKKTAQKIIICILLRLTMQNLSSRRRQSPKSAILSKRIRILKKIILRISMVILFIINTNQIVMSSAFLFN